MTKAISCPDCGNKVETSGKVECLCEKDWCSGHRCGAKYIPRDYSCECGSNGITAIAKQYIERHSRD